jgi:hypothetical protein
MDMYQKMRSNKETHKKLMEVFREMVVLLLNIARKSECNVENVTFKIRRQNIIIKLK